MTPHSVFISHAHADNELCDRYVEALKDRGLDIWYDRANMESGRSLSDEIENQLQVRSAFVVMLTKAAIDSYWVKLEIGAFRDFVAREPSRLMLPVRIGPCEIPPLMRGLKFVDALEMPFEAAVEEIARSLGAPEQTEIPATQVVAPSEDNRDEPTIQGTPLIDVAPALPVAAKLRRSFVVRSGVVLVVVTMLAGGILYLFRASIGQTWQPILGFGVGALSMLAYAWNPPWQVTGDSIAQWALRTLRQRPLRVWESTDGYAALQASISASAVRGDMGTVRAISWKFGRFLATYQDYAAERHNAYDRGIYRTLKGLITGCAQGLAQSPNAAAYYVGYVLAGLLLQSTAVGLPMNDSSHNLFSGIVRSLKESPERFTALWTGLRHALCRSTDLGRPYLMDYWSRHVTWTATDPRWTDSVGAAIAQLMQTCWIEMARSGGPNEMVVMPIDFYRDIALYLFPASRERARGPDQHSNRALLLLDGFHAAIMRNWSELPDEFRISVVNAYETNRASMFASD